MFELHTAILWLRDGDASALRSPGCEITKQTCSLNTRALCIEARFLSTFHPVLPQSVRRGPMRVNAVRGYCVLSCFVLSLFPLEIYNRIDRVINSWYCLHLKLFWEGQSGPWLYKCFSPVDRCPWRRTIKIFSLTEKPGAPDFQRIFLSYSFQTCLGRNKALTCDPPLLQLDGAWQSSLTCLGFGPRTNRL